MFYRAAMESEIARFPVAVHFPRQWDAERRVAGVAAAARIVREAVLAGATEIRLLVPGGWPFSAATEEDLERLRQGVTIHRVRKAVGSGEALSLDGRYLIEAAALKRLANGEEISEHERLFLASEAAERELLRRTGKASDGPVSRWLNRPISQRISAVALRAEWMRPGHMTVCTALIALAMFAALLFGGEAGLMIGAILFHTASVVDGVDGEMARASFRSSARGAAFDTGVDMVTNLGFFLGVTVNLAQHDRDMAVAGGWGFGAMLTGLIIMTWLVRRQGGASFDLLKNHLARNSSGGAALAARIGTIITSRDFFALFFALLILAGAAEAVLYIFALAATIWLFIVVLSVPKLLRRKPATA